MKKTVNREKSFQDYNRNMKTLMFNINNKTKN